VEGGKSCAFVFDLGCVFDHLLVPRQTGVGHRLASLTASSLSEQHEKRERHGNDRPSSHTNEYDALERRLPRCFGC
jgi:hypothetical protein